jgi:hypothetical protein
MATLNTESSDMDTINKALKNWGVSESDAINILGAEGNADRPRVIKVLLNIIQRVTEVFPKQELSSKLMTTENRALDGDSPVTIMIRDGLDGAIMVQKYLYRYM